MQFEVNWIQTTISLTITITIIINFISYSSPSSQMPPEIAATATTSAAAPLMLGMPNVCSKEDGQEYYTRKVPCTQARVKMVPIWKSSCTTTTTKTTTHSGINDGVTRTGNHHQRNHHHLSPSEKLFGLRQTNAIPEASASGVASSPRGYQTKSGGCIIYEPRVFQYNSYKIISEKRPRIVYDCCKGWRRENPTDPGCFLPECAENYCLNGGLCLSRNPFSKKTTASGTRGGRSLRKRRGRRKKIGSRKRRHKFYLEVTPSKSMIKHQISDVRTSGSLQHGLDVQITVNHEIPHYFHEHHHHHHHHHHYRPHHPHHHHHRPPDFDYDHKNESKSDKKEGVNALQAESYFVCKCPPGFEGNRCEYQSSKGCTWNKGGCQHICETLVDGSGFICKCRQGFQLNADSKTCSDLNECNSSNGGCQYRCHNTLGSFMCSCPFGYQLSVDRKSCMVQNKCWFNNGGCSQICTMEEDEDEGEDKENEGKVRRPLVRCTCFSGFKLDKDGRNCQDWNECLHNNNSENRLVCSQGCVNTFGSYYCTCYDGFSLGPDGHSCLQTENATSNPWSSGKDEEFSQGETSQVLIKGMNTSSESTYKPETTSTSVREASVQVYANTTSETTSENVDSGGLDGGGGDTSKSLSKSSTETVELTTQTRSVSSNTEDPLLKTLRTSELTNEKTLPPTTKMTRATDEMNETVTVSSFGVGVTREMKRKDDGTPTADPLTTKSTDYGNPPVPTTNTTAKVLGSHGSFPESPAVSKTDPKLETSTQITTFSPSSLPLGGEHGSKLNTDSPFINSVMDDVSTENVSTGRGETVNRAGHESDSNESGQRTSPLAGESDATTPTTSLPSTITKEPSSTQTDGTISLNWETITENGTITGKPTFNLTSSTLPSFSTENPGSSANPVEKSPPTPGKEDEIKLKPITDSPDLNAQNQTVTCNCLNGGTCDQITKKCYCPPGILGDRCESKCPLGFYGIKCDQKCPTSCQTNRCNRHYGFCECDDGFFGPNCNLACDRFTYGPNCRRTCDCEQVNSEQCHVSTGQCICKPGFTGPRCEQRCPPRTWGFNCSRLCECVSNSTCDSVTGVCKNNCPPGLMGNNCDVLCPSGSYGPGCENDCRCPHNAVCDPMTGNCICKSGYWGHLCAEECPPKLYGPNCAFECDCKQNGNCDSETGCCDCPSGYIGPQCENACPEGFFGKRCQDVCSCLNGATKCNHVNGECECPPGFTGTHCEKGCPQGFFGKNCEEECKCTNKWKECRADNGECVCPADASDDECSQEDEKLLPRSRSRGDQPPD